jgi:hypothetical protein
MFRESRRTAVTAPLPLREPFFLRGRKSVLQRAVLISLALGGLTAAAAWIVAAVTVFFDSLGIRDSMIYSIPPAWGLASALLIYAPLNYWNRRSWLWTLAAVPAGALFLLIFLIWMNGGASQFGEELSAAIGFFGVLLASGLLQVRARPLHVVAYALSVAGAVLPSLVIITLDNPGRLTIPGFTPDMIRAVVFAILFGSWFGALSIPWGIPFWWPPNDDDSTPPANPELLPDLLDR